MSTVTSIASGPYRVILEDTEVIPRSDWLRERKSAVCSSDYPMLVGLSSFGTAIDLYEDKIQPEITDKEISLEQKFRFDVGHALEPVILMAIAENIGARAIRDKRLVESTLYPYMRNDVDGLFVLNADRVIQGVPFKKDDVIMFEGKTTNYRNFEEYKLTPSPAHVAQSKHGMLVRGLEWTIIGYCKGNNLESDLAYHLVPLTDEDKETIPLVCNAFFEENVIPGIPPTEALGPYASDFKRSLIKYYSKDGRGNAVLRMPAHTRHIFEESLAIREQLSALNAEVKSLENMRDRIESQFVTMLGTDYQKGELDSIYRTYTVSISSSSSPNVLADNLDRLKEESPALFDELEKQGIITQKVRNTLYVRCKQKKAKTKKRKGK